jgi:hypothetical protein
MALYHKITAIVEQVYNATAPEPGQNTPQKVKDFHDALTDSLRHLSLLDPHEFHRPDIQTFIERTIVLKCHLRTMLDQIHIDEFMKKTGY